MQFADLICFTRAHGIQSTVGLIRGEGLRSPSCGKEARLATKC